MKLVLNFVLFDHLDLFRISSFEFVLFYTWRSLRLCASHFHLVAAPPRYAPSAPVASLRGDAAPSAHSTRFHTSRGWKVTMIAANRTISPPTAYKPMPGSTVASSAILIRATRMPSIITSLIDQGCMECAQRNISPTQCGAGGRLAA